MTKVLPPKEFITKEIQNETSIILVSENRESIKKMHHLMHHVHRAVLLVTVLYVLRTGPVKRVVDPYLQRFVDQLPDTVRTLLARADASISPMLTTLVGVTLVVGSLIILWRLERFYRVFVPNFAKSALFRVTGYGEDVELKARIIRLPPEELALILSTLVTLVATTLLVVLAQFFPSLEGYTSFFL